MEPKKDDEEQLSLEESSISSVAKPKIDWSHLNDLESLISEMSNGKKLRLIVYDTETTGLNYKKDHILELACVEVVNFGLTGKTFHIYIKPRVFVSKKVQELNHIKYDDFEKYWEYYNQDTKSQLQNFLEFVGEDSYLVAHNATFDYYFLNSELKYWGLPELPNERFRCTLRMIKKIFKDEGIETPNHKLFTCCEYFKILVNENEGSYHNALFDTIMTSKLLIHLYKKIANIKDDEKIKKNSFNQNISKSRYNKFDNPDNLNKNKKTKDLKKEEILLEKEKTNVKNINNDKNNSKDNNNIINNNSNNINNNTENVIENDNKNNKEDRKEIINEQKESESKNEIKEGELNEVNINLLIQKINGMLINEENKENKENKEIKKEE